MNEPTNADRAERAAGILTDYNAEHNGADGDLLTSAADLIADILHLADRDGADIGALIDRARMHHDDEETEEEAAPVPLADPMPHVRAGHSVRAYWAESTVGHVHWVGTIDDGHAEVFDTEGLDSGPTEEAECRTCSVALDPEGLDL
jgi:hypothetical protein